LLELFELIRHGFSFNEFINEVDTQIACATKFSGAPSQEPKHIRTACAIQPWVKGWLMWAGASRLCLARLAKPTQTCADRILSVY